MGKVPKLKLQVLKVRNIVIILSKLVNGIKLRIEVYAEFNLQMQQNSD